MITIDTFTKGTALSNNINELVNLLASIAMFINLVDPHIPYRMLRYNDVSQVG